jgi:ribonuclease E
MLIDASHAEETRVVVLDGSRIEEFDFESRSKKQLRGNIYLAKVTRVEPSLQAAFVEYGGNRHGFLAFNEIHPDYYQIPMADREALIRDMMSDEDDHHPSAASLQDDNDDSEVIGEADHDDDGMEEEVERRRRRLMRRYKIQEVIKRRQIMLIQVVKEERGNKGAALTTYLSLAGRYGVLMPNTARGGGISRKITTVTDRKRLKSVVQSLDVPQGMGLIVRTAGAKRTKAEIKRDYEYLLRLWENIRDVTLHSIMTRSWKASGSRARTAIARPRNSCGC